MVPRRLAGTHEHCDGHEQRHDDRGADCLGNAGKQHDHKVWCERRADRADQEDDGGEEEHRSCGEPAQNPSGHGQHNRHGQKESGEEPLSKVRTDPQVFHDGRKRNRDRGFVQHHDECG